MNSPTTSETYYGKKQGNAVESDPKIGMQPSTTDGKINHSGISFSSVDDLVEYTSERAADKLAKQIEAKQEAGAKKRSVILSLIGLVGFGTIVGLTNQVVQNIVRSAISEETAALNKRLGNELTYASLTTIARPLLMKSSNNRDEFDLASIKSSVKLLEELKNTSISQKSDFLLYFNALLDEMYESDYKTYLDTVEAQYSKVISQDPDSSRTMVDFYGEDVLGAVKPSKERMDLLEKYININQDLKLYPEKAVLWRMLYEFDKQRGKNEITTTLINQDIGMLEEEDRHLLYDDLKLYSDCNWWNCGPEAKRLTDTVNSFLKTYPMLRAKVFEHGKGSNK